MSKSQKRRIEKLEVKRKAEQQHVNPSFLEGAKVNKPKGKVQGITFITPEGEFTKGKN